ncbi:ATP-binding protein [Geodermatophilus sp. SYSU D00758]
MTGIGLAREAALLGAECLVAESADEVRDADEGWTAHSAARRELRARMCEHERSPDEDRVRLCDRLGLDGPAYWLVMLCAAVECHPEAAAAVSLLAEDPRQQLPTPWVVARVLRGIREVPFAAALSASLDGGAARSAGLVEVVEQTPGLPHAQQTVRLTLPELRALTGTRAGIEERHHTAVPPGRPAFPADQVTRAARLLDRRGLLVLCGPSRRAGRQLACDVAAHLGRTAHLVTVDGDLPQAADLVRMPDGLPVLDLHGVPTVTQTALSRLAAGAGPLVAVVDDTADTLDGSDGATVDVGVLGHREALRIWTPLVGEACARTLAARFRVSAEEARGAVRDARDLRGPDDVPATGSSPPVAAGAVAAQLLVRGARRMGRSVQVVTTSARLADLVVPAPLRAELEDIVSWHRHAHRVRWDMELPAAADATGTGLTCLLAGKPGTGKTFAARCLAGELGLNLYRVDLSQVVSKYIGETEKALARLFDEVEAGHGLLLFDEADALFGRRSEVKDAHDRYANIEVGYLLQRLEAHEGITVLTTNLQGNIDAAFVRRMRFILQFPLPDRDLRRRLWERSLPAAPFRDEDLELDALAERFPLGGGAIHNIGLAAAHLAAASPSGRVTAAHVLRATRRELQKAGRPADAAAFGPLAPLLNANGVAR